MDTLSLLSQSLRGAIIAPPGKLLFVADYAAIEARVLLWCVQDELAMKTFREGRDIYCDFCPEVYGYSVEADPDNQPPERKLLKVAILGLGYQMGPPKFVTTAWTMGGITLPLESDNAKDVTSVKVVQAYRTKYRKVVQYWYDMETAAGEATCDKTGAVYELWPVKWWKEGRFLYCQLPSGRRLAYCDPLIKAVTTSWGARKNALTYMSVNPVTKKWHRQSCYGGLLVENVVQAISRDIMGEAMLRCEDSRIYLPILTIHDEVVCQAHKDHGNLEEFIALVGQAPTWASDCPIAAEGWAGTRYRK